MLAITVSIPEVCGTTFYLCRYADLNQVTKNEYKKHDNTGKISSLGSLGSLEAVPFNCVLAFYDELRCISRHGCGCSTLCDATLAICLSPGWVL